MFFTSGAGVLFFLLTFLFWLVTYCWFVTSMGTIKAHLKELVKQGQRREAGQRDPRTAPVHHVPRTAPVHHVPAPRHSMTNSPMSPPGWRP